MATEQWEDGNARCFGMLLDGRAQESGVKRRGSDATLLLIYNAHHDVVNFTLPSVPEGRHWQGLIDTNRPDSQLAGFDFGDVYAVTGRSLLCVRTKATSNGQRQILSIHILGEIPDLQSLHLHVMDHDLITLTECTLGFISRASPAGPFPWITWNGPRPPTARLRVTRSEKIPQPRKFNDLLIRQNLGYQWRVDFVQVP